MKNLYLTSIFCFISILSFGQIVNIPDVNFKNLLVNTKCARLNSPTWYTYVDTNNDGEIQLSEAQNVLELNVSTNQFNSSNDILSMEGIASFINITKLKCDGNNFTSLDVSMLSSLIDLNCDNSKVNSLNVAGLTNLKILNCNFNSLTAINLSGLTSLSDFNCVVNSITALDLSDSLLLTNFQCEKNQISSLIFGDKPVLKYLICQNNPITTINPQLFPNIETILCSDTFITSIDLHNLNSLSTLELNSTLLSEIDCSQTPILNHLHCSNNPNLTTINVRNNYLSWGDPDMLDYPFKFNNLPSLTSICLDDGEQNNLVHSNYNSNGNVQLFSGSNCDIPLGISTFSTGDFDLKHAVNLYPNPTDNLININNFYDIEIQSIMIYNLLGQLVKTIYTSELSSSFPIDVNALKTGTYIVEISSNEGKTTKKFIKL